jgi:hypothetical protein
MGNIFTCVTLSHSDLSMSTVWGRHNWWENPEAPHRGLERWREAHGGVDVPIHGCARAALERVWVDEQQMRKIAGYEQNGADGGWIGSRKLRQGASNAGNICNLVPFWQKIPSTLSKHIIDGQQTHDDAWYDKLRFTGNEATAWGHKMEDVARQRWLGEENERRRIAGQPLVKEVFETGSVIDLERPYVSGSPDGVVLLEDGTYDLLEIKCPSARAYSECPKSHRVQMMQCLSIMRKNPLLGGVAKGFDMSHYYMLYTKDPKGRNARTMTKNFRFDSDMEETLLNSHDNFFWMGVLPTIQNLCEMSSCYDHGDHDPTRLLERLTERVPDPEAAQSLLESACADVHWKVRSPLKFRAFETTVWGAKPAPKGPVNPPGAGNVFTGDSDMEPSQTNPLRVGQKREREPDGGTAFDSTKDLT